MKSRGRSDVGAPPHFGVVNEECAAPERPNDGGRGASRIDYAEGLLRVREVAARYVAVPKPGQALDAPANAAAIFFQYFETGAQPQELLMAAYVDSRHRCLAVELLYRGSVTVATAGTRDVLRTALMLNAAGFVVAHVHPSGDPAPSREDVAFTRRLVQAAEFMNIDVVDHIVLGRASDGSIAFVSLRERGLM